MKSDLKSNLKSDMESHFKAYKNLTLRQKMQRFASAMELALSAFLVLTIVVLIAKLIVQSIPGIWVHTEDLTYYLEAAMTLAIGIEFVKMLCTHTPETIIEVLLFAIARQMIVEHSTAVETVLWVGAIAGLFAVRKFLFVHFDISVENERGEKDQ